jgi:hypothetical protein
MIFVFIRVYMDAHILRVRIVAFVVLRQCSLIFRVNGSGG